VVWELSAEPVVVIGDDSTSETTFDQIGGVHIDSAGRIWVVDGRSAEIRVFAADGVYLESWGGRGQGPGEFIAPRLLGAIRGDSLVVLDRMDQVIEVLSPEGESNWSARLFTDAQATPRQALSALDDGRVLFQEITFFMGDLEEGEVLSDTVRLWLLDPHDGSVSPLGPSVVPMWVWTQDEQLPMPFGPQLSVSTRGDTVFALDPTGSAVLAYAADGGSTAWPSPRDPERVRRSDHAEYRRSVDRRGLPSEMSTLMKDALDHPELPDFKPIYDRVMATDDGEVWARRFSYAGGPTGAWDVFSATGVVRGTVSIRGGFQVKQVTTNRVVGVIRDTMGVQTIAVYEKRPQRDSARVAAALVQVREELESLSELQQIYFADHMTYAEHFVALLHAPPVKYREVRIQLVSAGSDGWVATATHEDLGPGEGCALFWGNPTSLPTDPVTPERAGELACSLR
jgi:hypothetical protein